ncbi:MAG: response regulator transcription factor, partial [Clostridia bacterium]|nr:response regulator transcription factor [Clostridia bacterium]
MIRIGVCDDSRAFLEQMRIMLSDREKLECNISVELFLSGEALLRAHAKEPFNIVFLDMIMPHITGIEAARALRKRDNTVKIVFLTSTSEFAVESYSVKASNYLLKPVGAEKLYSCINELLRGEREAEDSVTVKSRLASYRVLLSQIEYVEAEGKLTVFNTRDKKRIETL